ncbi:MAG: tyrosine-type recombinase/integrase [Planctomycetes bacterium]|nr:tyrosine-type recombinase/integrase [Planctomycetota bacterium]
MVRKTGKKANYIKYKINGKDEVEVRDIVNGFEMGVSLSESNSTYYTMIPKDLAGAGAKRSKLVWLKSDVSNAVTKFFALISKLKGEAEKVVSIDKYDTNERTEIQEAITVTVTSHPKDDKIRRKYGIDVKDGEEKEITLHKQVPILDIPEAHHIEWLKRELLNPSALAKKTGIQEFSNFYEWMNIKHIKLSTIYNNYTNSVRYLKITDRDEKKKTKAAWELFLSCLNGKTSIEEIDLVDVKKFEKYLHQQDYTDKTINHYKNRASKVIKYNLSEYEETSALQRVLNYFNKWEKLEINTSSTIAAQAISKKDFMKLYNNADLQTKAVMMLCLNTGTYLREVARIKISDIDLDEQTLMTNRNKKGRCRKFAYLWDRTVKDLKAYLATRKDSSDVLFKAYHGGEYKDGEGLRTSFYKLRKDCKLLKKVEFNHLRDTFQTVANEISVSEYHSNMVMGHSSGKTKERYSHRRIHNELKTACLKVEREFFKRIVKQ